MSHPVLDEAFEKHVQAHLCSESYDFIKEVSAKLPYLNSISFEMDLVRNWR